MSISRLLLLMFGFALVACAVAVLLIGGGAIVMFAPLLVLGVACLIGGAVNLRKPTYKQYLPAPPAGDWQPTGERFIDTASGRTIAVYSEPASGERVYVSVGE